LVLGWWVSDEGSSNRKEAPGEQDMNRRRIDTYKNILFLTLFIITMITAIGHLQM
jgi:hypothetical protein